MLLLQGQSAVDGGEVYLAFDLQRFAAGLAANLPAVRAAFDSFLSSGQVEGYINRLKYLKRRRYGRAKLDLLCIRVLHPN